MTTDLLSLKDSPNSASVLMLMRPALLKYFLRKTGSAVEAEDLTQDVLVRALTYAHWESVEQAKAYIFRIAVNCWRDRRRKGHIEEVPVEWGEEAEEFSGSENSPEYVLIIREQLNLISKALEDMPVRTRAVLMLVKVEQMKLEAVANMLGISVRAVTRHLSNGVKALVRLRKRQEWS